MKSKREETGNKIHSHLSFHQRIEKTNKQKNRKRRVSNEQTNKQTNKTKNRKRRVSNEQRKNKQINK
jgi:hypothetical protein